MRIRLSITLRFERRKPPVDPIPPHDVIEGGAYVERAPVSFVGFARREPDEGLSR